MHPSRTTHVQERMSPLCSPLSIRTITPAPRTTALHMPIKHLYDRRLVLLKLPNAECGSILDMHLATLRLKYTANIMTPTRQIRSYAWNSAAPA